MRLVTVSAVGDRAGVVGEPGLEDSEAVSPSDCAWVMAATLSDIYSAVTAGIGALKGPLHGVANQDVINWLLKLGDEESAIAAVKDQFARKVKIPG